MAKFTFFRMDNPKKMERAIGVVTEALPNTLFRVALQKNGESMLAFLGGKMRLHRIRVLVGDSVELELDSYGGKGRIVKRL